jgi:hypothetical protein
MIPEDWHRPDRRIGERTTDAEPSSQAKAVLEDAGRRRGNGHGRS